MKTLLSASERHALTELKEAIAQKYELLWIKLFGSKARGDFDEESDIDVVIVLKNVDWAIEKDVYEMCFYMGMKHDLFISPFPYSLFGARDYRCLEQGDPLL